MNVGKALLSIGSGILLFGAFAKMYEVFLLGFKIDTGASFITRVVDGLLLLNSTIVGKLVNNINLLKSGLLFINNISLSSIVAWFSTLSVSLTLSTASFTAFKIAVSNAIKEFWLMIKGAAVLTASLTAIAVIVTGVIASGVIRNWFFGPDEEGLIDSLSWLYDKIRGIFGLAPTTTYGKFFEILNKSKDIKLDGFDIDSQIKSIDFTKIKSRYQKVLEDTTKSTADKLTEIDERTIKNGFMSESDKQERLKAVTELSSLLAKMPQKQFGNYLEEIDKLRDSVSEVDNSFASLFARLVGLRDIDLNYKVKLDDTSFAGEIKNWLFRNVLAGISDAQLNTTELLSATKNKLKGIWEFIPEELKKQLSIKGNELVDVTKQKTSQGSFNLQSIFSVTNDVEQSLSRIRTEYSDTLEEAFNIGSAKKNIADTKNEINALVDRTKTLAEIDISKDFFPNSQDVNKMKDLNNSIEAVNEGLKYAKSLSDRAQLGYLRSSLIAQQQAIVDRVNANKTLKTSLDRNKLEGRSDEFVKNLILVNDQRRTILETLATAQQNYDANIVNATSLERTQLISALSKARADAASIPLTSGLDDINAVLSKFKIDDLKIDTYVNIDESQLDNIKSILGDLSQKEAIYQNMILLGDKVSYKERITALSELVDLTNKATLATKTLNSEALLKQLSNGSSIDIYRRDSSISVPNNVNPEQLERIKQLRIAQATSQLMLDQFKQSNSQDTDLFTAFNNMNAKATKQLDDYLSKIRSKEDQLSAIVSSVSDIGLNFSKDLYLSLNNQARKIIDTVGGRLVEISDTLDSAMTNGMNNGEFKRLVDERVELVRTLGVALLNNIQTSEFAFSKFLNSLNLDSTTERNLNRNGQLDILVNKEAQLQNTRKLAEVSIGKEREKYINIAYSLEKEIGIIRENANKTLEERMGDFNSLFGTSLSFTDIFNLDISDLSFKMASAVQQAMKAITSNAGAVDGAKEFAKSFKDITKYGEIISFYKELTDATSNSFKQGVKGAL